MPRATQLGEGYRGPSGPTGYLLRQLIHAFHTTQEQGLRPYGLSSPQFGVLFVLDHEPGLSSADLARAMGVTPQAANLLVAGMERDGLVRREPHPTHKRVLETYPTDEGLRRMRAAQTFIGDLEERLLAGLGPAEREFIHRWLVTAAQVALQGLPASSTVVPARLDPAVLNPTDYILFTPLLTYVPTGVSNPATLPSS